MQDHEKTKEMDSFTTLCLDQLKSVQDNHSESVSTIRNKAEKCLVQDYVVGLNDVQNSQWYDGFNRVALLRED